MMKFNSRAIGKSILIAMAIYLAVGCNSIPQPCDPEFLASQQIVTATACRVNAEKTCPGYADMTEEDKLDCPGVQECLDKIEKAEADCHGK